MSDESPENIDDSYYEVDTSPKQGKTKKSRQPKQGIRSKKSSRDAEPSDSVEAEGVGPPDDGWQIGDAEPTGQSKPKRGLLSKRKSNDGAAATSYYEEIQQQARQGVKEDKKESKKAQAKADSELARLSQTKKNKLPRKRIVYIYEGDRYLTVRFKHDTILSASKSKTFQYPELAAQDMNKRVRRAGRQAVVIWTTGDLVTRSAKGVLDNVAESAVAFKIADQLKKIFSPGNSISSLFGQVAMETRDVPGKGIYTTRKVSKRVAFNGGAVGTDDGMWVRVGYDNVQATLVKNGEVVGWKSLGTGISLIEERLRRSEVGSPEHGGETDRFVSNLVSEVSKAIVEWLVMATVNTIWLHGPGAGLRGLSAELARNTGCKVLSPRLGDYKIADEVEDTNLLCTAVYAENAPYVLIPNAVFSAEKRAQRNRYAMIGGAYLSIIAVMGGISYQMGRSLQGDIDSVRDELSAVQLATDIQIDLADISDEAELKANFLRNIHQPVLEREPAPEETCLTDWKSVMELQVRELGEDTFSWPGSVIISYPLLDPIYTPEWVVALESAVERVREIAGGREFVGEAEPREAINSDAWYTVIADEEPSTEDEDEEVARSLIEIPVHCGEPQ